MEIKLYPDHSHDQPEGPVGRFLRKLKKRRDLLALIKQTFRTVEEEGQEGLDNLIKKNWAGRCQYVKCPIWEFRIPPTKKGGVVRLYYGHKKSDSSVIFILSAELKHEGSSNKSKIKEAEKRYEEVCK